MQPSTQWPVLHRFLRPAMVLVGVLMLSACQDPPACRSSAAATHYAPANAGCLIVSDSGLLLVVQERTTQRWSTPGGSGNPTESASCTAHRETWEETGLDVTVLSLLERYDNGFHLFHCRAALPERTQLQQRQAPFWWEVRAIDAIPASAIATLTWRFPAQQNRLPALLDQLAEPTP